MRRRLLVYGLLLGLPVAAVAWWCAPLLRRVPAQAWDDNGLWMRRHWLHGEEHAPVPDLVAALRAHGIRRIYPFLGPMDPDGWPGWRDAGRIRHYDPAVAGAFLHAMGVEAPEIKVLPWTGGNLDQDVHLADAHQRAAYAAHMRQLVAMGAAGVHLNVEPMPPDTPGYLELLRAVKAAIGPDAILSVAAYPPKTPLHPFEDVHWSLDYTREVCEVADDLVVMAYDTGLPVAAPYEAQVARWTRDLAATLPPGACTWSVGLPAYEDDVPWHRPDVETLAHGIAGLRAGLPGETPAGFTGAAIYASWTVDQAEWDTWDRDWRGQEPAGLAVPDPADP
ncbi:MAG: hypothetical protein ABIO70_31500 [Pseudomonadota bacterium]